MFDLINALKVFWFFILLYLSTLQCCIANGRKENHKKLFSEQDKVEELIRQWAPLVWLAPGEKFLPGDVTNFLRHVHAEKSKTSIKLSQDITSNEIIDQLSYYDIDNELSSVIGRQELPMPLMRDSVWENRNKRMFDGDRNVLLDYIIDLPIGDNSENWFLVSNDDIDDLLDNTSSFIYGQNPNTATVPIYAMVTMCQSSTKIKQKYNGKGTKVPLKQNYQPIPYIPVTLSPHPSSNYDTRKLASYDTTTNNVTSITPESGTANKTSSLVITNSKTNPVSPEIKRMRRTVNLSVNKINDENDNETNYLSDVVNEIDNTDDISLYLERKNNIYNKLRKQQNNLKKEVLGQTDLPHFHVTYWMFYPYSQGKTMCTLSLGPFGHVPIPLVFGFCLGTKRDFGSHIGDWEHMSLFFKGGKEPEEMYVSAHDAGAYYSYEKLTGTFDFRSQESRKGLLQHPTFPKTVTTSSNHPILFSAQGSHGLWTAPGKHKFVRVPRLFDINGFGIPWQTWKQIEFSYQSNDRYGRSIGPEWLKFNGRWGNPKSKCHPLKKIGLHFCEYFDGPTGIPVKKPHFHCTN